MSYSGYRGGHEATGAYDDQRGNEEGFGCAPLSAFEVSGGNEMIYEFGVRRGNDQACMSELQGGNEPTVGYVVSFGNDQACMPDLQGGNELTFGYVISFGNE